jgi:hypothetical protein
MPSGCTHITANNFDPNATDWGHNCLYVIKTRATNGLTGEKESFCLLLEDISEYEEKSFTASYSIQGGSWVFFHDYVPDYYFHTREQLFMSSKGRDFFETHKGNPGVFLNQNVTKPFFIDVVFKTDSDILLESVNWVSSVLNDTSDNSSKDSEWKTLTHISIWNSQQHTGRIVLQEVFKNLQMETSRLTQGHWSFNDFRNILQSRGTQFIKDLFEDYALVSNTVGNKPWYEKELLQDKYMVIRFEFDNSQKKQVILHDLSVKAQKTNR